MRAIALLLVAVLPACVDLDFEQESDVSLDPDALNILFIGNSLTSTNRLHEMVGALADSAGFGPVDVRAQAVANYGLQDHWGDVDLRLGIEVEGWDFVVLQQGPSATEGRPSLLTYAKRFGELIKSAGAQPALYMVWPSLDRSDDWDGVKESYEMAADSAGGIFLPGGEAWRVAWESDSTLLFYSSDGFHPTIMGTYLVALVIVEQLTGASPVGLPARFRLGRDGPTVSITPERADSLQEFARETNARNTQ